VIDKDYHEAIHTYFWPLHVIDTPIYGSLEWRTTAKTKLPEHIIGITEEGVRQMAEGTGIELVRQYPGYWKKRGPELYIQDVLIFKKA